MCGICGFYGKRNIDLEQLSLMNDCMRHRGPDDSGVEIYVGANGYHIGLAHRRLAIHDLTAAGHQPFLSKDKDIALVFNGEIYNYMNLKKELSDYKFISNSDTEVIIAAYLKWGISCVEKFNGMFAFAIYDKRTDELILWRDRIGKKPLYYWKFQDGIVFSSELKAIMRYPGFSKTIRKEVLPRYILQQYIDSPNTIFEDVYKLEPGTFAIFKNGDFAIHKYWDISERFRTLKSNPIRDLGEAKEALKATLREAIKIRLKADVPYGCLLSGGYDSSLISAMAQEALGDERLLTFSVGFDEIDYNEADYAKNVSDYLGTIHTEYYCDEKTMIQLVETIPQYFDEPFADPSEIPTMLVSKIARDKLIVALSGDGGDEFFCGYNIYGFLNKAKFFDSTGFLLHKIGQMLDIEGKYSSKIKAVSTNRDKRYKTQIIPRGYIDAANKMCSNDFDYIPVRYDETNLLDITIWQERRMLLDMMKYLPDDILTKVDRASMKYSLECRSPLLDVNVMELSFRLDHKLKYWNGIKKYILKEITYEYIPKAIMDRPKKGFSVPLDKWLRGVLRDRMLEYSDYVFLQKQGIFNARWTSRFIRDYLEKGDEGRGTGQNYSRLCWSFYVFQQWLEYYKIVS